MDPVGTVYKTGDEAYLYVSKFSNGELCIGQGCLPKYAVADEALSLDRKTAKALANILNEEAHAD